jgi:hypothetical protein
MHSLQTRVDESPARKRAGRAAAPAGQQANGKVRLSKIAHQLGIDTRTLRRHIADEPFLEHPVPRVWLVDEPSFRQWYSARGRKLT